jgi:Fic family protein
MTYKKWNWQHHKWPHFTYEKKVLQKLEYQFLQNTGMVSGVLKHIQKESKDDLLVEILSTEALKTSEIEGEILSRESVQSSIKKNLGLKTEKRKIPPAEFGISEMMTDLFMNYHKPLTNEQLFEWHKMICNCRRDLTNIGTYRSHEDSMQIVSGPLGKEKVHFEAPASKQLPYEMEQYIHWFNAVHEDNDKSEMLALTKAGIAHIYLVSIHPFEDGNGRIARAIAEKSIAKSIQQPTLISLSYTIEKDKKSYYSSLAKHNTTLDITEWLVYFGQTILDAQQNTLKQIEFLIENTKFFDHFTPQLNERQIKVIKRLFDAGYSGSKGGLSADNYTKIAKTSASTATRDLQDLVEKKILIRTGALKGTRYSLHIKSV